MNGKVYRGIIVVALAALTGLVVVQVSWFIKAYDLRKGQFESSVNLALREVSDEILKIADADVTRRIGPVHRTASNSYIVPLETFVPYSVLDSLVRAKFRKHKISQAFSLSVYESASGTLLLGGFYPQGIASDHPPCLDRAQDEASMNFAVTFPDSHIGILGDMKWWMISAAVFVLILFLFAYMIFDLSRQKRLSQMKADFISNMTHELQTPITNIGMASEVLRAGTPALSPDKTARYLDIIHQENQRLRTQVEQVLQTAQLERGELKLIKKAVDLNAVIKDVTASFQLRLQRRKGRLVCNLEATETLVLGDYSHLSNVLYNLLDNAEKYSPKEPEITLTTSNSKKGICIAISDKGIGIRKEVQKFIFEKFYRAPAGNLHAVKGFGLGLTYVQQIVSEHQGMVAVTSEENNGTCFEVWLSNYAG
ncbi:MAG TPA: HAMP domain-containing sensor histidine kinase [Ohtaekwangia sp.]|nr:HAMP domain-containing sensor histidine kinase [Ohtaekwangia sp.]